MKKSGKLALTALSLATLIGTSAFADSRPIETTQRGSSRYENQRITTEGHITSLSRERNGYRVQLDRGGYSYWIPESRLSNRARDLRVGVNISLGGIFRRGGVEVDVVSWPQAAAYDRGYLRGVVERVNHRRDLITVRDQNSGRTITVDTNRLDRRNRGVGTDDLRRGDAVTLAGNWTRGNVFEATRIESVNTRR